MTYTDAKGNSARRLAISRRTILRGAGPPQADCSVFHGAQRTAVTPAPGAGVGGWAFTAAGAAQQEGKRRQGARQAGAQAFAVQRQFAGRLDAAQVARHHHEFGGQAPLVLALRRGRGGTCRGGREGEDAKPAHGQLSLTFCSMPPPLSRVHSTIEPSYMRAFLLPSSSLETNQPTEAQWPVLQKLICSPLVGTLATL